MKRVGEYTFVDVFKLCRRHSMHDSIQQVNIYFSFKKWLPSFQGLRSRSKQTGITILEMNNFKDGAGKGATKGVAKIKNTKTSLEHFV